jgi:NitT/TauT family transport system permease protein
LTTGNHTATSRNGIVKYKEKNGFNEHIMIKKLIPFIVPAVIVVLWQLSAAIADGGIIPSPFKIISAWYVWIFGGEGGALNYYSGTWLSNVYYSLIRVIEGFSLSIVLGIPIGLLLGWSKTVDKLFDSVIQITRPIPVTAWVPFAIVLFGVTNMSALFLIFMGSFYPIVINTYQGVKDTPVILTRAAKMLGASERTVLLNVVLPSAMPGIFAGLRIAVAAAWIALIAAEMIAVKSGLGYVLWDAYYIGRMDIVLAAMLSVGIFGFLSDWIVRKISNRVLRWRQQITHN